MQDEDEALAQFYVLTKADFEGLEPEGGEAKAVLGEMADDDSVMLARVSLEDGGIGYLPVLVIRDEGASAVVNMGWIEEQQKDALYACLEGLDAFTRVAYETLGEAFPVELKNRRRRLEAALYSKTWWEPEEFDELDDALYSLETILADVGDRDVPPQLAGLSDSLDLAQLNFDLIRVVLYDDEEE